MVNVESKPYTSQEKNRKKLCKMLTTAALSASLVSWNTTAIGLQQYVFKNLWQAYVISAALQGALFALSMRGMEIIFSFKKFYMRFSFGFTWLVLVIASSIFSYSCIFQTVYPEKLLREDANRILLKYCLEKNFELSTKANELLNGDGKNSGVEYNMNTYVAKLAILENGIDLSERGNDKKINTLINTLQVFSSTSGNEKKENQLVDTASLIENLNLISSGKYTDQDITDVKKIAKNLVSTIEGKIANTEKKIEERESERIEYQNRLATFTNITSEEYKEDRETLSDIREEIKELEEIRDDLKKEQQYVKEVPNILNSVKNSMASSLYEKVSHLRSAMNAEEKNIENIQKIAEEIYDVLLNNSAVLSVDDERISGYTDFKNSLRKYSAITETQDDIDEELTSLYEFSLSSNIQDSANKISGKAGNGSGEKDKSLNEEYNTINEDTWVNYWNEHLNSIKKSIQNLHKAGLETNVINQTIEEVDEKARTYISDLNDFERAWSLLFSKVHPYKTLLIFSVIIAFGIDLFAVLMSIFLYLYNKKEEEYK